MTHRELEDERAFLLRSLEDLDREHEAGDLTDEDHRALRDEYIARAAAALRTEEGGPAPATRFVAPAGVRGRARRWGRPRRRRIVIGALTVVLIGAAVWALVAQLTSRLPGETVTGSVTLSAAQQTQRTLAQAQSLESEGDAADAVQLYRSVLATHPRQEQALAEVGWLEYEAGAAAKEAGVLAAAEQTERKAENVDPGAFAPHLYLGSMLLAQKHPAQAVAEYRLFLADHPPPATVSAAVPFLTEAFAAAHQPLPALHLGTAPKS